MVFFNWLIKELEDLGSNQLNGKLWYDDNGIIACQLTSIPLVVPYFGDGTFAAGAALESLNGCGVTFVFWSAGQS